MPTRPALQPCLLGRSNRQGAGAQAGDQRARDDTSHASTLIHILGRAHQLCGHHPCACAQRSGGAKHRACTPQPETLDRSTHRQDAGKRPIRVAVISYTTNAPRPSCQAAAAKIVHEVGHASHVTPPPGPMPISRLCYPNQIRTICRAPEYVQASLAMQQSIPQPPAPRPGMQTPA